MKLFFSVGEPSGDLHGANLIRELRMRHPQIEIVGYGGPKMAAAGFDLHQDLTELAVMWFARVLLHLHKFYGLLRRAENYFQAERPDAVVLIDYPGFNWHIARAAKRHGIPVFYYGPPQIWAWAPWRIRKMRRLVDHILCKLPFEPSWYAKQGCQASLVGHPYFDELRTRKIDQAFVAAWQNPLAGASESAVSENRLLETEPKRPVGPLVTLLPGSRTQEVSHNLRWLLKAAERIVEQVPSVRFAVATFAEPHAETVRQAIGGLDLPIEVFTHRTPELICAADCCLAVSGSVSLELLYHTKPSAILYWIGRPANFLQQFFRRVKYITLVNLLATDEINPADTTPFHPDQPGAEQVPFPEYLTSDDPSEWLAAHVVEWLTQPEEYARRVTMLEQLKAKFGHAGASWRAAEYILTELDEVDRIAA